MNIVFACVENSCRSQIAEAIARHHYPDSGLRFFSAGSHPASQIDEGAVQFLKQNGIPWNGTPKNFSQIDPIDILVRMGCEVACPVIPGVRMVEWNIPDPKQKGEEAYLSAFTKIKSLIIELVNEIKTDKKEEG